MKCPSLFLFSLSNGRILWRREVALSGLPPGPSLVLPQDGDGRLAAIPAAIPLAVKLASGAAFSKARKRVTRQRTCQLWSCSNRSPGRADVIENDHDVRIRSRKCSISITTSAAEPRSKTSVMLESERGNARFRAGTQTESRSLTHRAIRSHVEQSRVSVRILPCQ